MCGKALCDKHSNVSLIDKATLLCPGHFMIEKREHVGETVFDPTTRQNVFIPPTTEQPQSKKKAAKRKKQ